MRLPGARLSGGGRLHGPRQLGHLARRRLKFGYTLLVVALISNIMAIVLQALVRAARHRLGPRPRTGLPRRLSALGALIRCGRAAEIAIIATDIAEVIGTAIGLNLLFGIPLEIGVLLTALDVFLILYLQQHRLSLSRGADHHAARRHRRLLRRADRARQPRMGAADPRLRADHRDRAQPEMLYLAMGILGATVMPHNLYLHSAIVQTRAYGHTTPEKREALKFATIDSTVALMFALVINASILILAAATLHKAGRTDVVELSQAQALLHPLLGSAIAPDPVRHRASVLRLNSTVTATLAGQAVMEGFLDIRLPPWLRRLVTRAIAIIPAAGVTIFYGEQETGKLLILSQVILGLQLPFAVVPLVQFTADRAKMGQLVTPKWLIGFRRSDRRFHHRPQHQADLGSGAGLSRLAQGGQAPRATAVAANGKSLTRGV